MKSKFELKSWMTENREVVIADYNKMTVHQFFSGISLKEFMLKVYELMEMNNVKSKKRAASKEAARKSTGRRQTEWQAPLVRPDGWMTGYCLDNLMPS